MNTKGLVTAITFVGTYFEDIKLGFNALFIVRHLLEKASTANEAINLLLDLPVSSNCNILIADKERKMIVIECTPRVKNIRKPIIINKDIKVICKTNCFISNEMKQYERNDETYKLNERYDNVINAIKKYRNEDIINYIKNIV